MIRSSRRTGALSLWLLFSMPVLLMLGFFGINALWMNFARAQTQRVVDASALAAGIVMVDDAMLTGAPTLLASLETIAESAAVNYATIQNPVGPSPVVFENADYVFGLIDHPLDAQSPKMLKLIDSLELAGRRTAATKNAVPLFGQGLFTLSRVDVIATSKVKLDRQVAGFRPVFGNTIPVAPTAIAESKAMSGWKETIESAWSVSPPTTVAAMPTIKITIGGTAAADPYVLTVSMASDPATQTLNGIAPVDLASFGGQLVVPSAGNLPIAGTQSAPSGLAAALQALQASGAKRAYPLYRGLDGMGQAQVTRFVAARVTNVMNNGSTIDVTLTPAFLEHPSVVTETGRPTNPYLARVRLTTP
ncbi:MAG: hypothetical protein K2X38_02235 [Gemmataceae bacterium]|nr:hypothetical protein [Gemmataceae bacterium]